MVLSVIHVFWIMLRHLGHMFKHVTKDSVSKKSTPASPQKLRGDLHKYTPLNCWIKSVYTHVTTCFLLRKTPINTNKKYLAFLLGIFYFNAFLYSYYKFIVFYRWFKRFYLFNVELLCCKIINKENEGI